MSWLSSSVKNDAQSQTTDFRPFELHPATADSEQVEVDLAPAVSREVEVNPASSMAAIEASMLSKNYLEAERLALVALELFPREPGLYNQLAHAYKFLGRDSDADQWAIKGAAVAPEHVWLRLLEADAVERRGDLDKAKLFWAAFQRDFQQMPDGYFRQASIALNSGLLQEAKLHADQGVEAASLGIYDIRLAVEIDAKIGDFSQGVARWLKGVERLDANPPFYDVGAFLLVKAIENDWRRPVLNELWSQLVAQQPDSYERFMPAIIGQTLPLAIRDPSAFEKFRAFARAMGGTLPPDADDTSLTAMVKFIVAHDIPKVVAEKWLATNIGNISTQMLCCLCDFLLNGNLENFGAVVDRRISYDSMTPQALYNFAVLAFAYRPEALESLWSHLSADTSVVTKSPQSDVLVEASRRRLKRIHSLPAKTETLRIALCISGQLRGYRDAFPTWGVLGLDRHEVDIFVHVWDDLGRKLPYPPHCDRAFSPEFAQTFQSAFRTYGEGGIERLYPNLIGWFRQSSKVTEAEIKDFYKTDFVVVQSAEDMELASWPNHYKMYYKVEECFKLAQRSGKEYDLVIRIRPDKSFYDGPPIDLADYVDEMRARSIVYVDDRNFLHYATRLSIGDQFAVGSWEDMRIYSTAFSAVRDTSFTTQYMFPTDLLPHENFACMLFYNGITPLPCPNVRFAAPLDPERLSNDDLNRLLVQDIGASPRNDLDLALLELLVR